MTSNHSTSAVAIANSLCFLFEVKKIFPALIALALTGCQPDQSQPDSEAEPPVDPPPSAEEQRARSEKMARLLNEKRLLEKELEKIIAGAELDDNRELASLKEAIRQSESDFAELYRNHPRLQKLNYELSLWQKKASSRGVTKPSGQMNHAPAQIMKIRGEIRTVSKTLPEFTALEKKIAQLRKEAGQVRRTLATRTPEGKEILTRLEAIESEMNSP